MNTEKIRDRMRQRRNQRKQNDNRPAPIIDNVIKVKNNIGFFLSLIAFLIVMVPATYQLVDSVRVFLAALQEAQRKLILVQEEQGTLLHQVVQHQSQPTLQQVFDETNDAKFNEILDRLYAIEEQQNKCYALCNPVIDNIDDTGDDEQMLKGEVWHMEPPPSSTEKMTLQDCPTGTCPDVQQPKQPAQQQNRGYQRIR